jgi:hypothetical protein
MVLLKNALGIVDERANLLNKIYWCRSAIIRVATLKPPYRTQWNMPTIGIQRATVVTAGGCCRIDFFPVSTPERTFISR